MNLRVLVLVLFLFVFIQKTAKAQTGNFTKAEKSKIIQILLKTFEPKFRKQKKILFSTEFISKEVVELIPKRFGNKKVVFISEEESFDIRMLELFYYEIDSFDYKEESIFASISRVSSCFGQTYSYRFFKQNGRLKKENLEKTISECGPDFGPTKKEKIIVEDVDPPPPLKTTKPTVKIIKTNE